MVVVSCLRQKGNGPSEWNEKVFLLPKQNVMDAMSDMYGKARVMSLVWDGKRTRGGRPRSDCYNRKRKLGRRQKTAFGRDCFDPSSFKPI